MKFECPASLWHKLFMFLLLVVWLKDLMGLEVKIFEVLKKRKKKSLYEKCSFLAESCYMNHEFLYYCRCSLSPTGGLFATVGCLKFQIQINLRSWDCTNEKYFYLMIFSWYVFPGRENEVFRNPISMKSQAMKYKSIPKNKYLLPCIPTILRW